MARIRSRPRAGSEDVTAGFVEAVVKAIRDEEQPEGPVIFEVTTGSTDFVEVIVVWDRWSDLSADVRTQVVSEAYRQVSGQVTDAVNLDRISTIIPVTVSQALEMGVLPYSVQCSVHRSADNYEHVRQLMKREGAIETETGTELRLPTMQMAREARDRLQNATRDMIPEVMWQISQQVGRIIDY
ncbi:MAG: hypothetical protein WBX00_22620 [Isosphaeraceae bacterium]